jgi:hypothetical protein
MADHPPSYPRICLVAQCRNLEIHGGVLSGLAYRHFEAYRVGREDVDMTPYDKQKRLHWELTNVGLRAQATAAGLVQLCVELRCANLIDDPAIERIKEAIADEVLVAAPRVTASPGFRREVKDRLDKLFAGEQEVGSADALAFGAQHD